MFKYLSLVLIIFQISIFAEETTNKVPEYNFIYEKEISFNLEETNNINEISIMIERRGLPLVNRLVRFISSDPEIFNFETETINTNNGFEEAETTYTNIFVVPTDENGIATTKGFRSFGIKRASRWDTPRQWAIVTKGDDVSFINSDWGTGVSPWRMDISYDYSPADKEYNGSMFTERGLYKAGEEVHIKGVVRENIIGNWNIPTNLKDGSFTVNNSRGEDIYKGDVSLNEFGSYLIDFTLPADAPTGYYSVRVAFNNNDEELYSLSQSFRVEEFKPLEYESRLWVEDKNYYLGDTMPIKMSGWYLFGEPMISNNSYWYWFIR